MAQKNGKPVNLRDTVEVIGIKHKDGKKQRLKIDKSYKVHPLTAKNLVNSGHAKGGKDYKEDKKA